MKRSFVIILCGLFMLSCEKDKIIELDDYMQENNISATRHASGLYYNIIKEGTGDYPNVNNRVSAIYTGELLDGTSFDSSKGQAVDFALNAVIAGWKVGIPLINEGGIIELYIPYNMAYGANSPPGSVIKPYENLYFLVELVAVN